ncbi:hypothetical protein DL96DRAFT_669535 [Flagelloscypha sp. PMI_526]|nr:hypothetical protein DL96DRAFT_669535 [Flagelloscypha sp. PMI_526]
MFSSQAQCPFCRSGFDSSSIRKLVISGPEGVKRIPEAEAPRHPATCDICNKYPILGLRYVCEYLQFKHIYTHLVMKKCTNCPDWDCCAQCYYQTHELHPGHTFIRLQQPDDYLYSSVHHPLVNHQVRCDPCGKNIIGIRYHCSKCPNFNMCHICEALPHPCHPRDHPLLKSHLPLDQVASYDARTPQYHNATCDWCRQRIVGDRYKCLICDDYDHCETCENDRNVSKHPSQHVMMKIRLANMPVPQPLGPRDTGTSWGSAKSPQYGSVNGSFN